MSGHPCFSKIAMNIWRIIFSTNTAFGAYITFYLSPDSPFLMSKDRPVWGWCSLSTFFPNSFTTKLHASSTEKPRQRSFRGEADPSLLCQHDCKCVRKWETCSVPVRTQSDILFVSYNCLFPWLWLKCPWWPKHLKRDFTMKILCPERDVILMLAWISYEKPSLLNKT